MHCADVVVIPRGIFLGSLVSSRRGECTVSSMRSVSSLRQSKHSANGSCNHRRQGVVLRSVGACVVCVCRVQGVCRLRASAVPRRFDVDIDAHALFLSLIPLTELLLTRACRVCTRYASRCLCVRHKVLQPAARKDSFLIQLFYCVCM